MKAKLYSSSGEQKSEISLPAIFDSKVREDLVLKYFEAEKFSLRQRYSAYDEAGRRHSASGTISHRRHKWKGAYGKGISRIPRKKMWRRGTQFFWIGAEVSSTRGGRSINAPQGLYTTRKINRKEKTAAILSGLAATANPAFVSKRYSTLSDSKVSSAVIESLPLKTKDFLSTMKKIFGSSFDKVFKIKQVRSGKGKKRARKYKSNAGLLLVTSKDENAKISGLDIRKTDEIRMKDLYPLGRLTLYTQKALDELKNVA